MPPYGVQCVTENNERSEMAVEKRFHTHVIARAEELLSVAVPYGKSEIAEQVLRTVLAPEMIRAQNELDIRGAG